jgi:hypothetical protein
MPMDDIFIAIADPVINIVVVSRPNMIRHSISAATLLFSGLLNFHQTTIACANLGMTLFIIFYIKK